MIWLEFGLEKRNYRNLETYSRVCTRSTDSWSGWPATLKSEENKSQLLSPVKLSDSVPSWSDPVSVDRIHRFFREWLGLEIPQTVQESFVPSRHPGHDVDRIHCEFWEPERLHPNCLTSGPCGPGRHHGHDVNRGYFQDVELGVYIQCTQSVL